MAGAATQILHVYSGNMYGGIESMLLTLARTSPANVHHEFALCFEGRLSTELRNLSIQPHDLGQVRMRSPLSIWRARNKLRGLKPSDAVVFHAPWSAGLLGPAVPAERRIFWAHDVWTGKHPVDILTRLAKPSHVVANSRFTEQSLQSEFAGKTTVIPCPVDDASIRKYDGSREATRSALGANAGDVVIIMAARLEEWKGHRELLAALATLDLPDSKAWILGGPQKQREQEYLQGLVDFCATSGLSDRVKFVGQVDDVGRYLLAADIHCQPNSGPEPFGIAFVEALYAGLPVVTTNLGAAPELINEHTGILVEPGDQTALTQALHTLADSRELRAQMAAAAGPHAATIAGPAAIHTSIEQLVRSL